MTRAYTHGSETMQGKIFMAFIALVVSSCMQNNLKGLKNTNKFTQRKMFNELNKVEVLELTGKSKPQIINPLTKRRGTCLRR